MSTSANKWTAFLLSSVVPGAGQLAAGSWTCLAWFLAAGGLAAAWIHVSRISGETWGSLWLIPQAGLGVALCLASAEHAKRLLEERRTRTTRVVAARPCLSHGQGRSIHLSFSLDLACSRQEAWKLVSDLPRFLTIDPFHDVVTLMRDQPARGVDLILSHNAFGRQFLRFGRIVAWREQSGYTFSDLSARGPRVGFPHVFIVALETLESAPPDSPRTKLTIRIRGRWTSRIVPPLLGQLWVRLICREHARLLRKAL